MTASYDANFIFDEHNVDLLIEELKEVKRSTCSCFRLVWKITFHTITIKLFQTTPWVPMCSLPWAQCKRYPYKVNGYKVNGLCAHTSGKAYN
jgi:hypothetical protein